LMSAVYPYHKFTFLFTSQIQESREFETERHFQFANHFHEINTQ
jgi:hypothetical protein